MTEIYHGPWSPVSGDRPETVVPDDPYHPRYPDAGPYTKVPYTKVAGILNEPLSGAFKVRDMFVTVSWSNGN